MTDFIKASDRVAIGKEGVTLKEELLFSVLFVAVAVSSIYALFIGAL
tara:strand:- start:264 stop:404 length:141 start_codon:yes stop_codon:yes gene_type:complete